MSVGYPPSYHKKLWSNVDILSMQYVNREQNEQKACCNRLDMHMLIDYALTHVHMQKSC